MQTSAKCIGGLVKTRFAWADMQLASLLARQAVAQSTKSADDAVPTDADVSALSREQKVQLLGRLRKKLHSLALSLAAQPGTAAVGPPFPQRARHCLALTPRLAIVLFGGWTVPPGAVMLSLHICMAATE